MNWYALYTKPRKEDAVAVRLQDAQIEVLTPKLKSKRYKGNKLIETVEALFPCYLLAKFDKDKCSHLISYTRGVRYQCDIFVSRKLKKQIINAIKERMK